jgi:hypothetical protein
MARLLLIGQQTKNLMKVQAREQVNSQGNQECLLSHQPQRRLLTTQIVSQMKGYLAQKMDRFEGILANVAPHWPGSPLK